MADNKETQSKDQHTTVSTVAPKSSKPQRKPGLLKAFHAGKKKQDTVKANGIVSGEFNKVSRLQYPKISRRKGIAILVICVLVVSAIAAVIFWRAKDSNEPAITKIQSESDYIDQGIKDLRNNVPDSDASDEEKIAYYDRLQGYSEQAEDYRTALDAFLKRAAIRSSDLDYMDYAAAARYYTKLGDKQGANAAIDKAISLLPPKPNESTGYDPALTKEELLKAKQQ